MATCRQVITTALRKIGVVAAGREPRANDTYDALSSLQSLYFGLIDGGAFGRLRDVIPLVDYTAGENERVFRSDDGCTNVTLPETLGIDIDPCDGWGLFSGNISQSQMRPPRDCSVVIINDAFSGSTTTFLYDGSVKQWIGIDALMLDQPAPLSSRNPDGLSALLAMQIVDQFGGDMPQGTVRAALQFQSSLLTRYSAPREEAAGVYV